MTVDCIIPKNTARNIRTKSILEQITILNSHNIDIHPPIREPITSWLD